jgi:hypothetical protein
VRSCSLFTVEPGAKTSLGATTPSVGRITRSPAVVESSSRNDWATFSSSAT